MLDRQRMYQDNWDVDFGENQETARVRNGLLPHYILGSKTHTIWDRQSGSDTSSWRIFLLVCLHDHLGSEFLLKLAPRL
jgi:hypothetical protein